jgi:hypothetical protein
MASSHYNADSAAPPPSSLVSQVRSILSGSSRAQLADFGAPHVGAILPTTPSSIG